MNYHSPSTKRQGFACKVTDFTGYLQHFPNYFSSILLLLILYFPSTVPLPAEQSPPLPQYPLPHYMFPRWEHSVPSLGMFCSQPGNVMKVAL